MRTAGTLLLALLACAGCPSGPPAPPPGPVPQGQPFNSGATENGGKAGAQAAPVDDKTRAFAIGMLGREWILKFEWPDGVQVTADRLEQDGTVRRVMSVGDRGRLTLSIVISPAPAGVTSALLLRDLEWNEIKLGSRFTLDQEATFETGAVAGASYRVPTIRGIPENRRDHHCWLLKDGVAIHAWVTKSHAGPDDLKRFATWANTLRTVEEPATPADRVLFGRAVLGDGAPNAAARALPQLREAAEGWTTLTPEQRLRLTEATGRALLALDRADDALQAAERLAQEPAAPPLAQYLRAQALSALDRNEEAVAALAQAFAGKDSYAALPDPSNDDWFILLGDDPRFEALVKRRAEQIAAAEKK